MTQLDNALLLSIKKQLIAKKVTAVKTRVKMGDLTIEEAGEELKLYMDRLDKFSTLEEIDQWLND